MDACSAERPETRQFMIKPVASAQARNSARVHSKRWSGCRNWPAGSVSHVTLYSRFGVVSIMAAALEDDASALHASCSHLRSAGGRLLQRAQSEGLARDDFDDVDLFALIGALGWIGNQPGFASRTDHLLAVIAGAILTKAEHKG